MDEHWLIEKLGLIGTLGMPLVTFGLYMADYDQYTQVAGLYTMALLSQAPRLYPHAPSMEDVLINCQMGIKRGIISVIETAEDAAAQVVPFIDNQPHRLMPLI